MSDIVTNAEVEDVLSSIRRLVGDNKRPVEMSESGLGADRLVLTPQLRVSAQDVLLLQPEDAVTPAEDWYEFEEPPLPEPSDVLTNDYQDVGDEKGSAEPDFEPSEELPTEAQNTDTFEDEDIASEPDEPTIEISEKRQDFFALSAKIAALETAIAKTADQWEPDGDARDAYAGTRAPSMTWQADVDLDAKGKPLQKHVLAEPEQTQPETVQTQSLEEALDEQIIDEDMLRELVADIVRSELQGDLGERITRNVRKLVRREIHRALAAQSLD